MNIGNTFSGLKKPKYICLDQEGCSMFGVDLVWITTLAAELPPLWNIEVGVCWYADPWVQRVQGTWHVYTALWMLISIRKHWVKRWLTGSEILAGERFFRHDNDPETTRVCREGRKKGGKKDLAKCVRWLESNSSSPEDFKAEGRATKALQQRAAEKNHVWGVNVSPQIGVKLQLSTNRNRTSLMKELLAFERNLFLIVLLFFGIIFVSPFCFSN